MRRRQWVRTVIEGQIDALVAVFKAIYNLSPEAHQLPEVFPYRSACNCTDGSLCELGYWGQHHTSLLSLLPLAISTTTPPNSLRWGFVEAWKMRAKNAILAPQQLHRPRAKSSAHFEVWGVMTWRLARRIGLVGMLLILYLASTVPIGLFLYSLKNRAGIDIFSSGGFHTYAQCLRKSFPLRGASLQPIHGDDRKRTGDTSGLGSISP